MIDKGRFRTYFTDFIDFTRTFRDFRWVIYVKPVEHMGNHVPKRLWGRTSVDLFTLYM